ncbi:MAG: ATP-binding cassette domain-containing protein [Flavobacteriales bacterium]|jgi:ABC-2 type transport system ATP-binding protein|tara:strand:+ start:978 stop:1913 length:936 start_codon:yes stop_codon:yes gene_type:complete
MSKLILEAKHIVKNYASHRALNDVSIAVPEKTIFGLLGPNGAGKTSLIRIINQITGPDSGEIFLDGELLNRAHIKDIGYLPEERGLYKKMKVGEQALYLAQLKGMDKAVAKAKLMDWFERFEISEWWNKKVDELSKGMAQKIQFITTVLHEPKLLILDEPFSGFDPINTNLVKSEILRLKEKGTSIILSTHNMDSVEEICDSIALINKSEKLLDGTVKDIKDRFKTQTYELDFTGSIIGFTNALWTNFELLEKETEGDNHKCKVKILNNKMGLNELLSATLPEVKFNSVSEVVPSMNDIFIQVIEAKNAQS